MRHQISHSSFTARACGFTFVELCIVMVIVGVMVAAAMQGLTIYYQKSVFDKTKANIASVETELRKYVASKDAYPCPALFTAAPETPAYGQPDCAGAVSAAGTGGKIVRIGAVPTRALGLPDTVGNDGWGQKLTYAITEDLVTAPVVGKTGAISVVDKGGTELTAPVGSPGEGHYVVFSYGPDAKGAYAASGVLVEACPPDVDDTVDAENCNDDAVFRYSEERSLAGNEFNYDDVVAFRSTLASSDNAECDVANGQVVVNFANGEPQCGALPLLNLDACPAGQYMIDVTAGVRFCSPVPACGNNSALQSVNGDYTGNCVVVTCPVGQVKVGGNCTPYPNPLGPCGPNQVRSGAACVPLPTVPTINSLLPNCAAGYVLSTDAAGNPVCVVVGGVSGEWCGSGSQCIDENGSPGPVHTAAALCQGLNPGNSCPSGYRKVTVSTSAGGTRACTTIPHFACIKN